MFMSIIIQCTPTQKKTPKISQIICSDIYHVSLHFDAPSAVCVIRISPRVVPRRHNSSTGFGQLSYFAVATFRLRHIYDESKLLKLVSRVRI